MNKELTYSTPEEEGVSSEYIINFLNEMEKREAEIHGMNRIGRKSHILSILLQNVLQIQRRELHIQKDS